MPGIAEAGKKCDYRTCRYWSDVDVYFKDGSSSSLCGNHASEHWTDKEAIQMVLQHGGPCNVKFNPNEGKNVKVEVKARILGPCLHWKTKEVIGYHVSLYLGRNRARVNTMILLENIHEYGIEK